MGEQTITIHILFLTTASATGVISLEVTVPRHRAGGEACVSTLVLGAPGSTLGSFSLLDLSFEGWGVDPKLER